MIIVTNDITTSSLPQILTLWNPPCEEGTVIIRVGNRPSVTRHRPNRRPRFFDVVSSRHLTSRTKYLFVRLFVRPQVGRRYDRCWLWISTNSIVSIRTASSKSTKKFGRCRVYSYFQYILLCVTGYIWSALRMTRFLWQNVSRNIHEVSCGQHDSCDRITGIWYNVDQIILIHTTINSPTKIIEHGYLLEEFSSNLGDSQ
jgi:hypothetical protein